MLCPSCLRPAPASSAFCVTCGERLVERHEELRRDALGKVRWFLQETYRWPNDLVADAARHALRDHYRAQEADLVAQLSGATQPRVPAPPAPAPAPAATAESPAESAMPVTEHAAEPPPPPEGPMHGPPRPTLWQRHLKPFLGESVGWFIGAFLILSGTLYFVADAWAGMSSTLRALTVFGFAAGWTLVFAAWARFLGRRPVTEPAARALWRIAAVIAPLASVALGAASGAAVLVTPLLVGWSAVAGLVAWRVGRASDEAGAAWTGAASAAATLVLGAAPWLASLGAGVTWVALVPAALAVASWAKGPRERGEATAFALAAMTWPVLLVAVRLHVALGAAAAPGVHAVTLALLGLGALRLRAVEGRRAADGLSVAVVAGQGALLVPAFFAPAPTFVVAALLAVVTSVTLAKERVSAASARWLFPAYAFGYVAFQHVDQLVPDVVVRAFQALKVALGYASAPLPASYASVYAALFVVGVGVVAAWRFRTTRGAPRAEASALLFATAVGAAGFGLLALASLGADARPALIACPLLAALGLALGAWLDRKDLTWSGSVVSVAAGLAFAVGQGAALPAGALALVLALRAVPATKAHRWPTALASLALAGLAVVTVFAGARADAGTLLALGLASAAALLVARTLEVPGALELACLSPLLVLLHLGSPLLLAAASLAAALALPAPGVTSRRRALALAVAVGALLAPAWRLAGAGVTWPGAVWLVSAVALWLVAKRALSGAASVALELTGMAFALATLVPLPGPWAPWPGVSPVASLVAGAAIALAASVHAVRTGRGWRTVVWAAGALGVAAWAAALQAVRVAVFDGSPLALLGPAVTVLAVLASLQEARARAQLLLGAALAVGGAAVLWHAPGAGWLALLGAAGLVGALLAAPEAEHGALGVADSRAAPAAIVAALGAGMAGFLAHAGAWAAGLAVLVLAAGVVFALLRRSVTARVAFGLDSGRAVPALLGVALASGLVALAAGGAAWWAVLALAATVGFALVRRRDAGLVLLGAAAPALVFALACTQSAWGWEAAFAAAGVVALCATGALLPSVTVPIAALALGLALVRSPEALVGLAVVASLAALLEEAEWTWRVLLNRASVAWAGVAVAAVALVGAAAWHPEGGLVLAAAVLLPVLWVRATGWAGLAALSVALTAWLGVRAPGVASFVAPALALGWGRGLPGWSAARRFLSLGRDGHVLNLVAVVGAAAASAALVEGPWRLPLLVAWSLVLVLLRDRHATVRLTLAAALSLAWPGAHLVPPLALLALAFATRHRPDAARRLLGSDDVAFVTNAAALLAVVTAAGACAWGAPLAQGALGLALAATALLLGVPALLVAAFLLAGVDVRASVAALAPVLSPATGAVAVALAALAAAQRRSALGELATSAWHALGAEDDAPSAPAWWASLGLGAVLAWQGAPVAAGVAALLLVTSARHEAALALALLTATAVRLLPVEVAVVALAAGGAVLAWAGALGGSRVAAAWHHAGWVAALLALGLAGDEARSPAFALAWALAAVTAWAVARAPARRWVGWVVTLSSVHAVLAHVGLALATGAPKELILPWFALGSAVVASLAWSRTRLGGALAALAVLETLAALVLVPAGHPREAIAAVLASLVLGGTLARAAALEDDEGAAVLGQVTLVTALLSARWLGFGAAPGAVDAWLAVVLGAVLAGASRFLRREGREKAPGVLLGGALFWPLAGLVLAPWGAWREVAPLLAALAVHFTWLSRCGARRAGPVFAALAFNAAVAVAFLGAGATALELLAIPAGLSLLALLQVFRGELSEGAQAKLRGVAMAAIYGATALRPLAFPTTWGLVLCAVTCVLGVAAGVVFRIRSYVLLGTVFLVTTVVATLVRYGIQEPRLGALFLSALGLLVVAVMVVVTTRRAQVQAQMSAMQRMLAQWQA